MSPSLHKIYDSISSVSIFQAAVTFFILYLFYSLFWKYRNVPPGPWGLPLLGYWPFLKSENVHLQLQKLQEQYGEIFSYSVTGNLFISLNSIKLIKEAHLSKSDNFGDRYTGYSLLTVSFDEALPIANGEPWKVQRKFFKQKFKEFGLLAIKEDFKGPVYDKLKETIEDIRAMNGEPFSVTELLTLKCSSIIKRILFNDQGITEQELKELNREYEPVLASQTEINLLLMGNIARFLIFPFMPTYWAFLRGHHNIQKLVTGIINRHKENFDESQVLDIIDCFYKEKKDRERKGDPTAKYFTDKALLSSIYQFVTDGVLSIAFFIGIFLKKLVEYPEEQEKVYEELIDVLGPDRQPTMDDKSRLPYTSAFIYEVIRFSNFIFFFPSQKCTRETTLNGYRIPKGAVTVINLWAANRDPKVYDKPDKFNPSRFIAAPRKPRSELPVMFGVGKRACMGEPFAIIETFLFVATIVKNFKLEIPDSKRMSSFFAAHTKICAHPRNAQEKNGKM